MKSIQEYIVEKMVYKKSNASTYKYYPNTKKELKQLPKITKKKKKKTSY